MRAFAPNYGCLTVFCLLRLTLTAKRLPLSYLVLIGADSCPTASLMMLSLIRFNNILFVRTLSIVFIVFVVQRNEFTLRLR